MTSDADHTIHSDIRRQLLASAALKQQLADEQVEEIAQAAQLLIQCLRAGNRILLCGNGGSAADAQHLATELVSRFLRERAALPAIALTTNSSSLTAIANDYTFADVFARQVEAFGRTGDVLIGISTSGNSENVLRALQTAGAKGLQTLALTGAGGGKLAAIADQLIAIPSDDVPRIQEAHIAIGHILCDWVEKSLFAN